MYQFVQNIAVFLSAQGFTDNQLYLLGLLCFIATASTLMFWRQLIRLIILTVTHYTHSRWREMYLGITDKFSTELIIFDSLYEAVLVCPLPTEVKIFFTISFILFTVIFIIDLTRVLAINTVRIHLTRRRVSDQAITTALNFFNVVSLILLWSVAIIVFMILMNIDISGLLSGLGIASIVVAFAFQNALKNIFAFFTIYVDRVFSVGDYVTFDKYEGTITEIRLRTTRIKALLGNELIVPNDMLVSGVIENFDRFKQRRVSFSFKSHVVPAETLEAAIADIKRVFADGYFGDRVTLLSFTLHEMSDYGLLFKIIYRFSYIRGESNYYQYLEMRQAINLALIRIMQAHHIPLTQLEYPTQDNK